MAEDGRTFLDVPLLLERSQPKARGGVFLYAVGFFVLVVLLSAYAQRTMDQGQTIVQALSSLMMLGLMIGMGVLTYSAARSAQREQAQLEGIEELIQLRRWEEAGLLLQNLLERPTRSPQARTQGLVYLGAVLARYHRFADAVTVYEYLLEHQLVAGDGAYAMKLARAMSLLREDRLVDADRALGELRRSDRAEESGGLALLEIYRDVKTGHPHEAIEIFNRKKDVLRRQLGHSAGGAYALVARAHDLAGDAKSAQEAFEKATLLSPMIELKRRYPEIAPLEGRYSAAAAPVEVGG